jgi:transposase InsO family protein
MDGRGRALDNVFVERLWRTVKYEEVYLREYSTVREAQQGLGRYFGFYNDARLHQALGYRTPGYALKAGQLTYDCRYSTMHGMPVTGGRGFRGLKPLWYNGVPP